MGFQNIIQYFIIFKIVCIEIIKELKECEIKL